MIGLLVTVIIVGLIFALVWWGLTQLPLPAPFAMVARVLVVLIAVIFLISLLMGGVGGFGGGLNLGHWGSSRC